MGHTHNAGDRDPTHRRFAAGDTLIDAGSITQHAYIIERGDAAAWREDGRRRTLLAQLGPGQMIGGLALLDQRPHTATVTAITDCSVRVVSQDDLTRHLGSVHPVVHTLIDTLVDRLSWRSGGHGVNTLAPDTRRSLLREHWIAGHLVCNNRPIHSLDDEQLSGWHVGLELKHVASGAATDLATLLAAEQDLTLLAEIRQWLLQQAAQSAASDIGTRRCASLTLRARMFTAPGLVDDVSAAIASHGIHPEQMWLAIREDELPDADSEAWASLQTCRRAGVRVAISAFGAKLAPMAPPLRGEVDAIVLAESVVGHASRYSALTDDINRLARTPGLQLIAPVDHSPKARNAARALGCTLVAGAPVPPVVSSAPTPEAEERA